MIQFNSVRFCRVQFHLCMAFANDIDTRVLHRQAKPRTGRDNLVSLLIHSVLPPFPSLSISISPSLSLFIPYHFYPPLHSVFLLLSFFSIYLPLPTFFYSFSLNIFWGVTQMDALLRRIQRRDQWRGKTIQHTPQLIIRPSMTKMAVDRGSDPAWIWPRSGPNLGHVQQLLFEVALL